MQDHNRVGRFSSSSIWRLMTNDRSGKNPGVPFYSYIQEKKYELLLGRELVPDKDSRPTGWGLFNEARVFDMLPLDYKLEVHKRYFHKKNAFWSGSPDIVGENFVGDIKCPFTLLSFCEGVDSLQSIETFKDVKPEWYWQIVSNAILTEKKLGEIVIYCPYKKDIKTIRNEAMEEDTNQSRVAFINFLDDEQLPYIPEGGFYKDLNPFRFEIPQEDIDKLTDRVTLATKLLTGK
jgi:hypothetical protein